MAESGTTGILPSAEDLGVRCGSACVYYIAVVAQRFLAEDPPPVFQISLQTSGKLNFVPCPENSPDGTRVVTGRGNRQPDGSVPHTYYAVCARKSSSPPYANESVLGMSYEQCTGESSLYISDTDPDPKGPSSTHQSLLPNTSSWGHRLTGNSTCSRSWSSVGRRWSPALCSDLPSTALLLLNRSNSDKYYLLAAGAGEYKVTVQDGKAPPVQLGVYALPRGGVGLKGRPWVSSSERYPVKVGNSVAIEWGNALTFNRSRDLIAANLTYSIYIIDLDAAKAQRELWSQNIHLDTLCGLQWAQKNLNADAVRVRTYQYNDYLPGDSNNRPPHRDVSLTLDLGPVPPGHTVSIIVAAVCNQSCMQWLSNTPCGRGLVCQTQSVVYSPLVILSRSSPSDGRPAFGKLFIFTFWVAVTALLFMMVVGVKLMHDRGIIADLCGCSSREPASLSTPYADSLGENTGGWWRRWGGYAQLSFTEMVETSTFGAPQGSGTRPSSSSSGRGDGEGVPQPSTRDVLIEQGARLMNTARDGLSVAAAGVMSLSRTVGSALSDTASAVFSKYSSAVRREGTEREGERDIDRSTHPLNTSSYRPPSPVPLASKSDPASASLQDSSAFIAMTAIYPDAADSREPSEYTSFPSRDRDRDRVGGDAPIGSSRVSGSGSGSGRGARTAAIRTEDEDSEGSL